MSSKQDIIIKGKDNPLVLNFTFEVYGKPNFGLSDFTDIQVEFGGESYSSVSDPTVVVVNTNTQLQLNLGSTAEEYASYLTITGYHPDYPNGYELTSKCLGNLTIPRMCGG